MSKEVYLGDRPLPDCDICPHPAQPARFNSPTRRDSVGGGSWANMCTRHMNSMGVMTSVTEEFIIGFSPEEMEMPSIRQRRISTARREARQFGTHPSWFGLTERDTQ